MRAIFDVVLPVFGLIFAGMSKLPESLQSAPEAEQVEQNSRSADPPKRIGSYGVANPIREVLDGLKIDLLI